MSTGMLSFEGCCTWQMLSKGTVSPARRIDRIVGHIMVRIDSGLNVCQGKRRLASHPSQKHVPPFTKTNGFKCISFSDMPTSLCHPSAAIQGQHVSSSCGWNSGSWIVFVKPAMLRSSFVSCLEKMFCFLCLLCSKTNLQRKVSPYKEPTPHCYA